MERLRQWRDSLKRLIETLRGLIVKQKIIVRFFVVMSIVVFLCVSGLTLIQLTLDYRPSDTNEVNDRNQVEPNYPTSNPISNVGSLKTIGIEAYWDGNLTDKVNVIDWGILEPGSQRNIEMYFYNEGNFAVTLSKSTSNWNPAIASSYLTVSWNYNGQPIEAGENLPVALTLNVSTNVEGVTDFDFDIIVLGTG